MKYDLRRVEQAIADIIKPIELGLSKPMLDSVSVKPYNGEFDGVNLPEEYQPDDSPYCFVEVRRAKPGYDNRLNVRRPKIVYEVVVFLGAYTASRETAKDEVLERLPILTAALQNKTIMIDGDEVGTLLWEVDERQFAIANSVCWASVYQLYASYVNL